MRRIYLSLFAAAALVASTACGLDKTSAPGMAGPSEFGTSVSLTAAPEVLPRDGTSRALIQITVRDSKGSPVGNRAMRVLATAGRLFATDGRTLPLSMSDSVTTGSNGVAQVYYEAPGVNEDVSLVSIQSAPVDVDFANSVPRFVQVRIVGPSIPVPSFTWTPQSPAQFALTTFDGSGTKVGGVACGSACTYDWEFSGEGTATGAFVTHRFEEQGTYRVTLTATSAAGASASVSNNVTVAAGVTPSARIRVSPASPCVGTTVFFNASESTAANGAEITEYEWDFGNGTFGAASSSATTTVTYNATGSYTVMLTVTDSNGLRGTATTTVTARALTAGVCN